LSRDTDGGFDQVFQLCTATITKQVTHQKPDLSSLSQRSSLREVRNCDGLACACHTGLSWSSTQPSAIIEVAVGNRVVRLLDDDQLFIDHDVFPKPRHVSGGAPVCKRRTLSGDRKPDTFYSSLETLTGEVAQPTHPSQEFCLDGVRGALTDETDDDAVRHGGAGKI
jgi:hypothetical protein